jgi:serine/threonine protein kinase
MDDYMKDDDNLGIFPNPNMYNVVNDTVLYERSYKTINPKQIYKKIFKKNFNNKPCFPNQNPYELYENRIVGMGSYGTIFLGYDCYNNRYVGIKRILLNNKKKSDESKFYREIESLKNIGCHKNILCYYDHYIEDMDEYYKYGYIITEYLNGKSLDDYLNSNKNGINYNIIIYIFKQLINGVEHIHEKGYAHRDLKPQNIIIDNQFNIKIIDFGLACKICDLKFKNGTSDYMPPESFEDYKKFNKYDNHKKLKIAKSHDIWSLSVILYQILNNPKFPYESYSSERNTIFKSEYQSESNQIDSYLNKFVDKLFILNYKDRFDIETVKINFLEMEIKIKNAYLSL